MPSGSSVNIAALAGVIITFIIAFLIADSVVILVRKQKCIRNAHVVTPEGTGVPTSGQ